MISHIYIILIIRFLSLMLIKHIFLRFDYDEEEIPFNVVDIVNENEVFDFVIKPYKTIDSSFLNVSHI